MVPAGRTVRAGAAHWVGLPLRQGAWGLAARRKSVAILAAPHFTGLAKWALRAPFRMKGAELADVRTKERSLQREIADSVERSMPDVEVIAVELSGPERFTVFVDHPRGVDHALCKRVTGLLRGYLDRFTVDVSSPGVERPLRKPAHFSNVVGRRVVLRTADEIAGRKRFRGELLAAGNSVLTVRTDGNTVDIPYEAIVRGNLIDEG